MLILGQAPSPHLLSIAKLKELAAEKKSVIRVFGRLDVHFFSVNAEGEVDSAVAEIVPEEKLEAFFADALKNAVVFRIEGRIWKRELNRRQMQRLLK